MESQVSGSSHVVKFNTFNPNQNSPQANDADIEFDTNKKLSSP